MTVITNFAAKINSYEWIKFACSDAAVTISLGLEWFFETVHGSTLQSTEALSDSQCV